MVGKINWAIYDGEDDIAIANQNVAIIRGNPIADEWIKLFFKTETGIEYLEAQLKFLSHCGVYNHISVRNLAQISIPDQKLMPITENVRNAVEFEEKEELSETDRGEGGFGSTGK